MQICVFTPPSKGFLHFSVLSMYSPYSKQIDFFDFGMKDNLENDLVGVEPAASIVRLTVVCLLRVKTTARVWYLTPLPTQHISVIFSRVNFFLKYDSNPFRRNKSTSRLRCSLSCCATSLKLASLVFFFAHFFSLASLTKNLRETDL